MPSEAVFKFGNCKIVKKMHGCKKFSKPNILGARVSGMWRDNIFNPGVIRSVNVKPTGETSYTVEFDNGLVKDLLENQIVGASFLDVTKIHLKFNQRVFITHIGKEVVGYVQKHRKQTNEVFIKLIDENETLVRRKPEDVRLLPNMETVSSNFTPFFVHKRFGGSEMESKKRAVSDGIEVPCAKTARIERRDPEMNEVMAAMILTSLSGSPAMDTGPLSPISDSCSVGNISPSPSSSSSQFSWDFHSQGAPSPGLPLSDAETSNQQDTLRSPPHATPVESMPGSTIFSSSLDEGIDMGEGLQFQEELSQSPKKVRNPSKTLYKCTWQGCTKTLCTVQGIERHIRVTHLGKRDCDFSDHEEEFYYTEIETSMEAVSDTFASMMTSSPPPFRQDANGNHLPDGTRFSFQKLSTNHFKSQPTQSPLTVMLTSPSTLSPPGHASNHFNFSSVQINNSFVPVQHPTSHCISPGGHRQAFQAHSPAKLIHHQRSSPISPVKIRAEGRKCRKVYGMENRELWCTQCKWKKACTRFL